MRDLCIILADIANTKPIENLSSIVGKELGEKLNELREAAARADRELDIVHRCLTDLYNNESAVQRVKSCLNEIKQLN